MFAHGISYQWPGTHAIFIELLCFITKRIDHIHPLWAGRSNVGIIQCFFIAFRILELDIKKSSVASRYVKTEQYENQKNEARGPHQS